MKVFSSRFLAALNRSFLEYKAALMMSEVIPKNETSPVPVMVYSPAANGSRRTFDAKYFMPPLFSVSAPIMTPSEQRKPAHTLMSSLARGHLRLGAKRADGLRASILAESVDCASTHISDTTPIHSRLTAPTFSGSWS